MLSELQKRKLMNQFRSNDRDRDGQIERSEMLAGHQDLLARKGWQPTMPEYKAYMASIEGNRSGEVIGEA